MVTWLCYKAVHRAGLGLTRRGFLMETEAQVRPDTIFGIFWAGFGSGLWVHWLGGSALFFFRAIDWCIIVDLKKEQHFKRVKKVE